MADIQAGKALWEAGIDRSQIPAQAAAVNADIAAEGAKGEQAATASATSTLAKVQGLTRAAASTVALGAGAMFGVATKLAADGENAMAKYQAQTGATADEAKAAFDSMNRLAGQNLQSFGTISDALTQVTTNMGLTGKAAEGTTNLILKFSTATGTDAVQNVSAFDDVLDSWGKTAADLPGIMDMIVASTQKYGGSTTEATAALKDMAPALRGMGASMSDGIALLDLFRASGVDASGATAGLARAVKTLKPGQTLDDLIAQIGAIEDPTLRAQKAIEIFGKSGAKLGNAIQPGMTSLKDFGVAATDAAGATDKAASAIEDTLPNKVKLAVDGALTQARGFATDFGPALMGASSLASIGTSLATAFKLDKSIPDAMRKALGSSAMTSVLETMGGGAGTTYGKAFSAAGIIGIGAMLGYAKYEIDNWVNQHIGAATTEIQQRIHAAFVAAEAQGPAAANAFFQAYTQAINEGKGDENALTAANAAVDATLTGVQHHISDELAHMWSAIPPIDIPVHVNPHIETGRSGYENDQSELAKTQQELADRLKHMWSAVGLAIPVNIMEHTAAAPVLQLPNQVAKVLPETGTALDAMLQHMWRAVGLAPGVAVIRQAQSDLNDRLTHMWTAPPTAPARELGVHYGEQFIVGFKSTRDQAKSEWQQYLDDLAHPHRGEKTVGWIVGKLTGEDLAKGLASSDPVVRHSAEQEQQNLRVQLQGMLDDGYTIGKKTLAKLGLGIVDGKIVAITAAEGAVSGVTEAFGNTSGLYGYGADFVNRWSAGMLSAEYAAKQAAGGIVRRVGGTFRDDVPIPADAPEHIRRIGEYGGHFIDRWVGGMWARGSAAARSAELLGSHIAGSLTGGLGPMQSLTGGGATIRHEHSGTVKVELSGDTIAAARAQGASWDDIGRIGAAASGSQAHLRTISPRQYA